MRSRTKWASFSFRYLSCSRLGPPGPTVSECSSLGAGLPASVVVRGRFCLRWSLISFLQSRMIFLNSLVASLLRDTSSVLFRLPWNIRQKMRQTSSAFSPLHSSTKANDDIVGFHPVAARFDLEEVNQELADFHTVCRRSSRRPGLGGTEGGLQRVRKRVARKGSP